MGGNLEQRAQPVQKKQPGLCCCWGLRWWMWISDHCRVAWMIHSPKGWKLRIKFVGFLLPLQFRGGCRAIGICSACTCPRSLQRQRAVCVHPSRQMFSKQERGAGLTESNCKSMGNTSLKSAAKRENPRFILVALILTWWKAMGIFSLASRHFGLSAYIMKHVLSLFFSKGSVSSWG